jgi:hypothetical protein
MCVVEDGHLAAVGGRYFDLAQNRPVGRFHIAVGSQAREQIMATNTVNVLPPAKHFMKKIALAEAEKASETARKIAAEEAARSALIDHLRKPSGVSDDEAITRAVKIIEGATTNGLTEVLVYRFPNSLCTDRGRAINQQEPGWEATLTGIPKEIYDLWVRYFRDQGYRLKVQIIDFPGGMPGDIGMMLSWG